MKLDNLHAHWRLWATGLLIALAGVVLARVAAPYATGNTRTLLAILGRLTAVAGLVVIAIGVRKRTTDKSDNDS